jgi:NADH-ubiquinone oxidoreductase chain 1
LGVLVRVAFIVLLERKVLGYIQLRKGPNKVSYLGILQSLGDSVKLFIKEQIIPIISNLFLYYISPVFSLFVILLIWLIIPYYSFIIGFNLGGLFFFCCTRFRVYTLMGRGWSSNSNYSLLGAIRGVAQTISYEVRIFLIFLRIIFILSSLNLINFNLNQEYIWFLLVFYPLFLCWLTSSLAETNRTPFDFAEGESELVSGFNIEYGRGGFALLFISEYGIIIFISYILTLFFFGGLIRNSFFIFNVKSIFFCFMFIWVRGTLPRYRYDKLINLAWKIFLPISLNFIFFYSFIKFFM